MSPFSPEIHQIVVFSPVHGMGTTTLTFLLAKCLASLGQTVLLVDAGTRCDLTQKLVSTKASVPALQSIPVGDRLFLFTGNSNFHEMRTNAPTLACACVQHLTHLAAVSNECTLIIWDLGAHTDVFCRTVFTYCTGFVVPCVPNGTSKELFSRMEEMLSKSMLHGPQFLGAIPRHHLGLTEHSARLWSAIGDFWFQRKIAYQGGIPVCMSPSDAELMEVPHSSEWVDCVWDLGCPPELSVYDACRRLLHYLDQNLSLPTV